MCGIVGFWGDPKDLDRGAFMRAVAHRGPDGQGVFETATPDGPLWIGHTRLAIIDLSDTGAQPMSSEDGSLTLAFNGEIYNHRELRRELEASGHRFRGTCDTEVALQLFLEHGRKALDRLRGMFALALWDAPRAELLLARDPLGIKPLYYVETANRLTFASEVRALLAAGAAERRLDPEGVESYLAFGAVMGPRTIVRGIQTLPPGGTLRKRSKGQATLERRRLSPSGRHPASYREAVEAVGPLLRRAVSEHLESDVPVALLLSSGIDSGALLACLARLERRPESFTVVFGDRDAALNEGTVASQIAQRFSLPHRLVRVDEEVASQVAAAVHSLDQPSADAVNTHLVSAAVRSAGFKVALSGLGADEVFLGYPSRRWFSWLRRAGSGALSRRLLSRLAGAARPLLGLSAVASEKLVELAEGEGSAADAYAAIRGLFPARRIAELLPGTRGRPVRFLDIDGLDVDQDGLAMLSRLEMQNYLPNVLLRDTDAMSMALGLELRVPYLDRSLVEQVMGLSTRARIRAGRQKALLVDAIGPVLPEQALKGKRPFLLPFHRWLREDLRSFVETSLAPDRLERVGLNPKAGKGVWETFLRDPSTSYWSRPWALSVLSEWARTNEVTAG